MKKSIYAAAALLLLTIGINAQKGVDPQTEKIKDESKKTVTGSNDNFRSIDFGKGKTKVRAMLANPYKLNARRDVLTANVTDALKEMKILVDDKASRPRDGVIVTQPFIFAKGMVTAQSELSRYAVLPETETSWTRGQYTLTIEVQPIDGVQNNVSVNAKVEGRSGNGLVSEWTTLQSSGNAEDEFLSKLIEIVTGNSPDAPQTIEP